MVGSRYGPRGRSSEGATQAKACRYKSFLLHHQRPSVSIIAHHIRMQVHAVRSLRILAVVPLQRNVACSPVEGLQTCMNLDTRPIERAL